MVGSSRSSISRAHCNELRHRREAARDDRRPLAALPAAAAHVGGLGVVHLEPRRDAVAELLRGSRAPRRRDRGASSTARSRAERARRDARSPTIAITTPSPRGHARRRPGSRASDSTSAPFSSFCRDAARDEARRQTQVRQARLVAVDHVGRTSGAPGPVATRLRGGAVSGPNDGRTPGRPERRAVGGSSVETAIRSSSSIRMSPASARFARQRRRRSVADHGFASSGSREIGVGVLSSSGSRRSSG